ncbi:hypothetical protein GH714_018728 [Hevea brasiliensis]|uniref:Uncharacterized protein n=1 Tax=Hevea brasiliensis TaxID=3981 RepID=A0A6A6LHM5_HEVBR|nr:hypothetical protein GH714_018728 [Hevea brasiliensis]
MFQLKTAVSQRLASVFGDSDTNRQAQETKVEKERRYLRLYKAALRGDWEAANRIFKDDPDAVTAKISGIEEIALHVAISKGRTSLVFIQKLVYLMNGNSLDATVNVYGETPLHYAAIAGNIPVIKILVTTNRALLQKENSYGLTPLHYAAQNCHKEAVSFLLSETDYHQDPSPFTGEKGATLVNLFIIADFYDEALHLLRRYPNLAIQKDNKGKTALEALAKKPYAFPSGSKLGFCGRLIYRCLFLNFDPFCLIYSCGSKELCNLSTNKSCIIAVASVNTDEVPRGGDLESTVDSSKENQKESKKFGFLHNIKNTNLEHNQALHLLRLLITEALKARPSETRILLKKPLQISARLGIYEMVVEIIKAYPRSDWVVDRDGNNIFNLAIVHRQEFFFSLLKRLESAYCASCYRINRQERG